MPPPSLPHHDAGDDDSQPSMHPKPPKEKKRLGRGLSALFGEEAEEALGVALGSSLNASSSGTRNTPRTVPIETLTINPFQPRRVFRDDMIEELAISIKQQGLLQPIIARKSKENPESYQIIAGERRWRASMKAGLHDIPVVLREVEDEDLLPLALVENLHRDDLTPMEEAEAYQKLMTMKNLTQKDVASILGKSRPAVANALRLLTLPPSVRKMVDEEQLTPGHARLLVGLDHAEDLARMIVEKQWSVRRTEKAIKKAQTEMSPLAPSPKNRFSEENPEKKELEKQLSVMLNCQVSLDQKGTQPVMTFRFSSVDAMEKMIQQMKKDLWYRKNS